MDLGLQVMSLQMIDDTIFILLDQKYQKKIKINNSY
jgi:hypothetical protein